MAEVPEIAPYLIVSRVLVHERPVWPPIRCRIAPNLIPLDIRKDLAATHRLVLRHDGGKEHVLIVGMTAQVSVEHGQRLGVAIRHVIGHRQPAGDLVLHGIAIVGGLENVDGRLRLADSQARVGRHSVGHWRTRILAERELPDARRVLIPTNGGIARAQKESGWKELSSRSGSGLQLRGRFIEVTFREQIDAAPERANDQVATVECLTRRSVIAAGSRLDQRRLEIGRVPLDQDQHRIQEIPLERHRWIELRQRRDHD